MLPSALPSARCSPSETWENGLRQVSAVRNVEQQYEAGAIRIDGGEILLVVDYEGAAQKNGELLLQLKAAVCSGCWQT